MSVEGRELAACPFCGGPARGPWHEENEYGYVEHVIACDGCCPVTIGCGTADESVAAWNRRATPPDPLRAALGKLADECATKTGARPGNEFDLGMHAAYDYFAARLRTLLAQPAAGTPTTTEGEK